MPYVKRDIDTSTIVVTRADLPVDDGKVNDVRLIRRTPYTSKSFSMDSLDEDVLDDDNRVVSASISRDTVSTYVGDSSTAMYSTSIEDFMMEAFVHWIPDVFFWGEARTLLLGGESDSHCQGSMTCDTAATYPISAEITVDLNELMSVWCHTGQGAGNIQGHSDVVVNTQSSLGGTCAIVPVVSIDVDSEVKYICSGAITGIGDINGVTVSVGDGASLSLGGAVLQAKCHITRHSDCIITPLSTVSGIGVVMSHIVSDVISNCVVGADQYVTYEVAGVCLCVCAVEYRPVTHIYCAGSVEATTDVDISSVVELAGNVDIASLSISASVSGVVGDGAALILSPDNVVECVPYIVRAGDGLLSPEASVECEVNRLVHDSSTAFGSCVVEAMPYIPEVPILKASALVGALSDVVRYNGANSSVIASSECVDHFTVISPQNSVMCSSSVSCEPQIMSDRRIDIFASAATVSAASSHSMGWDTYVNHAWLEVKPNPEYIINDIDPFTCTASCEVTPTRIKFNGASITATGLNIVASGVTEDGCAIINSPASLSAGANVTFDTYVDYTAAGVCVTSPFNDISTYSLAGCEASVNSTVRVVMDAVVDVDVDASILTAASRHVTGVGIYISVGGISSRGINTLMSDAQCNMGCEIHTWPVINANWDQFGVEYAAVTVESMSVSVSGGQATLTVIPG
jgi:hypothetical protein